MGRAWAKDLSGRIEGYEFQVGILEDKPHMEPEVSGRFETPRLKSYAGDSVRPTSRKSSGLSIGQVLVENMKRLNINILLRPFQESKSEIMRFSDEFLKMAIAKKNPKRVENLLQAIVRNPILRQEYGQNSPITADEKGFNRHLFDTGQMFKAIRAKVKRRVRK